MTGCWFVQALTFIIVIQTDTADGMFLNPLDLIQHFFFQKLLNILSGPYLVKCCA